MQDDARHRLDASANGHGRGPGDSMASTAAAGQQSDHRDALTEKNLDKHTRLNPPCARDTVAWFLQGLQPGLGAGANHSQVQVRHSTQEKAEASRNRQETRHVSPIRQPDNAGEAIYGSQDLARMAADPPDGVQVEAPLAGDRLTEQRKFLLASMRSKHDKQAPKKAYKTALPSVSSSPPSSAAKLQEVERAVQVTNHDPSKYKQAPVVLAEETQPAMEVRFKDDKERAKRTLSDPDSTERARKERRRRSVEQQEITKQVKARSKAKQREKALQSVLTSTPNPERQQVLDQRKERRRAKAVIVKERSKVTGPSEAVVKANKKASKPTLEVETSKYRKGDRHLHSDDRDLRKHKRSGHRENEQVSETSSVGPEGDRVLDKHRSRKKRSTDVTRSMAALKDADKGGKATTKRRKDGPLDRARNIVPTGRVTLKSKTGIYNHGQASTRLAVTRSPRKLTDLAFSELPFLNQTVEKPPQSRLLHKQDSSAYRSALQDDIPSKMVPSDTQNAQPEHAPTRPTRNDGNQRFTGIESDCCTLSLSPECMDIRPRSPKQRNFGVAPAPNSGMAINVTHSDKTVEQVQDQSEVSCNAAHHKQGLSLESRQVGAHAIVPSQQSVGATPSRTSHHLSTIAESGQLSSLTGLSAGSLVRRRLLRRMEEFYTETIPHASRQSLEAELRAFRSAEGLGQQFHGPSAKTGAAVIPRNNMAPMPDLPAPTPQRLKALVPVTSQQKRIAYHQAENRSPDWFASKASAATGADFNDVYVQAGSFRYPRSAVAAQSQVSHLDFIEDPSYIQLGDNFSPIAFPAYAGEPYDAQSYQEQRYEHSHIQDGYAFPSPLQAPHVSQSFPLPLTTPQLQAGSQQSAELHRGPAYQHAAAASLHGDPYRPAEQPSPQHPLLYSHTTAHFSQDFEDLDYADDAARFQRGRADLHNYIPEPPFRAPLQTLQGFWYRNNL